MRVLGLQDKEGRMERTCRVNEGGAVGEVEEAEVHEEAVGAILDEEETVNHIVFSTRIISR